MIRRFETRDLDEVMSLWLHANIEIHSFIETDYWKKNYDMVRKLIPEAEVFVAQEMAPDRLFSKLKEFTFLKQMKRDSGSKIRFLRIMKVTLIQDRLLTQNL